MSDEQDTSSEIKFRDLDIKGGATKLFIIGAIVTVIVAGLAWTIVSVVSVNHGGKPVLLHKEAPQ